MWIHASGINLNSWFNIISLPIGLFFLVPLYAFSDQPGDWYLRNGGNSGSTSWEGWEYEYFIGNDNMEGLVLKNVKYKGHQIISKASLPIVRVKYRGEEKHLGSGCGPWPDKFYSNNFIGIFTPAFSWRTIYPYKSNLNNVVFFTGKDVDGDPVQGVFVYAEIGGYLLWHGWNFTKSGRLEPILYSSGWSCDDGEVKNDHRHHPYWRIDFAVDNELNDVYFAKGETGGMKKVESEIDLVKEQGFLGLIIASTVSDRRLLIKLEKDDAPVDRDGKPWFGFSKIDAAIRLFKRDEDEGWRFGAKGELGFNEQLEPVDGKDTVIWLIGHLDHRYVHNHDDEKHQIWHWSGPLIQADKF